MEEGKLYYRVEVFAEFNENTLDIPPTTKGIMFKVPKMVSRNTFYSGKGAPNKQGHRVISKLLVEALAALVHSARQDGYFLEDMLLNENISYLKHLSELDYNVHSGFGDITEELKKHKTE